MPSDEVAATPENEQDLTMDDQAPPDDQTPERDESDPVTPRTDDTASPAASDSESAEASDDEVLDTDAPLADAPGRFHQVHFIGVEMVLPSPHPILVLREVDAPGRRLQIPIGAAEGIAIAFAARGVPTPRPLTHELFTQVMLAFDIEVATVRITEVVGTTFRAEIVFTSPRGARTLSCRPSDGVALALRQQLAVPITVAADVLEVAGI